MLLHFKTYALGLKTYVFVHCAIMVAAENLRFHSLFQRGMENLEIGDAVSVALAVE